MANLSPFGGFSRYTEKRVARLIIKATKRRYDPIMRFLRTNLFELGAYAPLVGLFSL